MGERAHTQRLAPYVGMSGSRSGDKGTMGQLASGSWLNARGLSTPALTPWHVEVSLGVGDVPVTIDFDASTDTRLRIEIYSDEWGVYFCHEGRASWIRVTDIAFAHVRDDFGLLHELPTLHDIGDFIRRVEVEHALAFHRGQALIRTNVPGAEPVVRAWLQSL